MKDALTPEYQRLEALRREGQDIQAQEREVATKLRERRQSAGEPDSGPKPIEHSERSHNELRPERLREIVGQRDAATMMGRVIGAAKARGKPLNHSLLVGPAGTGKTTFANVIANELGRDCYPMAAPVSLETLLELREVMQDGDILYVDEIHMQAVQERRGKEAMSAPEVFLTLLEDFVIATASGMLDFPRITVIGATTDPGRLPDPFLDRFPLQPKLDLYSQPELAVIAERNARALGLTLMPEVAKLFAGAARGTPRIVNNYMRNADDLCGPDRYIVLAMAEEVLDFNSTTRDGLTREMQDTLRFLFEKCRRETAKGDIAYSASISTIATAIGLSRDTKAVQLRVEPYLIQCGFLQVGHGGRALTPTGIRRATQLLEGDKA